jgi:tetratricopeptide (TPR) repeat protein
VRPVLLCVAFLAHSWPVAALAQRPVDAAAEFNAGRRAYEQRRYQEVVKHLRPLLYPNILLASEEQTIDAHKLLGISHLMLDDREAAKKEFVSLIGYRPDYVFDPTADPPKAVAFFESVRKDLDKRAREARDRQAREEERRRLEEELRRRRVVYVDRTKVLERVVDRRTRWPLYVPFGYGQFDNKQRTKGWFFLGTESALLGATVATVAIYAAGQGHWHTGDATTIRALQGSIWAGGVAFVGVVIWGIVDALKNAPPRETVIMRDAPPSPAPTRASLRLTPGGLALEGAF